MDTKVWVSITVQDSDGVVLNSFLAWADTNIAWQANQHACDIPTACCSGACFVCACRIIAWAEYIDIAKFWQPLVSIQDGQVLTCIAGIKDQYLTDGQYHEIVLQKLL